MNFIIRQPKAEQFLSILHKFEIQTLIPHIIIAQISIKINTLKTKARNRTSLALLVNRLIPAEALADMPTALPFVSYQAA